MKTFESILTNDVQRDEEGAHRLRGHLALVHARVALLHPLDLQRPVVRLRRVGRLQRQCIIVFVSS